MDLLLDGEFTVDNATRIKQQFLELLETDKKISCDLQSVIRIDSSGFQILMALKKQVELNNGTLKLQKHSAAIIQIFELFGVTDFFGDVE